MRVWVVVLLEDDWFWRRLSQIVMGILFTVNKEENVIVG